jgi:hypothetical protein
MPEWKQLHQIDDPTSEKLYAVNTHDKVAVANGLSTHVSLLEKSVDEA